MESRPNNPTCPVCKSVIDKDKLIPLYGRGATDKSDPREKIPPRPPGHREEPHDLDQVTSSLLENLTLDHTHREMEWEASISHSELELFPLQ